MPRRSISRSEFGAAFTYPEREIGKADLTYYNTGMYDLIVIGAGAGGLNIAVFMNSIGLRVLLVERTDEAIGGDCLNAGCIPSKALIHAARVVKSARDASRFGVNTTGGVDFRKVRADIESAQDTIRAHENAEYFRDLGITVILGHAEFSGEQEIIVEGKKYRGKNIVIATGSTPRMIRADGIEKVKEAGRLYTNETIFSLSELPKKLLVVGAGPIGIELGQAFHHFGTEVSVVSNDARILSREDEGMSAVLLECLLEEGMSFYFNSEITAFTSERSAILQKIGKNNQYTVDFDAVLVAVGRTAALEGLSLEQAGIKTKEGALLVNKRLQTTNPHVYACGDVLGQHQFTHAAELHARLIIRNLLIPLFKRSLSTEALSWVTYTSPELATFGPSEALLKKQGIKYTVIESSFKEEDRAITAHQRHGYAKLFVHPSNGKIFGGTMLAPNAGELIQELILAASSGLTMRALFDKTYPYPTATRINKRLASIYAKGKLTVGVQSTLRALYRIFS